MYHKFQSGLALAIATTVACTDGSVFKSGLTDSTEKVEDLDTAESDSLCTALGEFVNNGTFSDAVKNLACQLTSILAGAFAGNQAVCEESLNDCLSTAASPSNTSFTCNDSLLFGCTATVGELEACITDTTTAIEDLADQVSCDQLSSAGSTTGSSGSSTNTNKPENPISCTIVAGTCPSLFSSLSAAGDATFEDASGASSTVENSQTP
jgi:hypothetical protein